MFSAYGFGSAMGSWGGAVSDQLLVPFADAMLLPVPMDLEPHPVWAFRRTTGFTPAVYRKGTR
jgi:hypothetical protein